jgi:DNA-binding transcriptional LysR family regulator
LGRTDQFTGLSDFLAVADHRSFRAAALGVTPAAVSQAIRLLEQRVGLPLFQRTTRNVGLTEAGERLLARMGPAAIEMGEAIAELTDLRRKPLGLLRVSAPRIAMELVLVRVLDDFRRAYPDVKVEIDVNDSSVDLAANRLDAGIRIGEFIDQDMVAVRITREFQWVILGSPGYFATFGEPRVPRDLLKHECIRYRFPTSRTLYRWQFVKSGREYSIDPPGGIIVNDHTLTIALAKKGLGLAYTANLVAARELAEGELKSVLVQHLPAKPGLFLYFPRRSQDQPKIRAFIEVASRHMKGGATR